MERLKHYKKQVIIVIAASLVLISGVAGYFVINSNAVDSSNEVKQEQVAKNTETKSNKSVSTDVKDTQKNTKETTKQTEKAADTSSTKNKEKIDIKKSNSGTENSKQSEVKAENEKSPEVSNGNEPSKESVAETENRSVPSKEEPVSNNEKPTPEPQKVWHDAVYQDKWVVEQAAWDETISEPIYENQERAICNVCGADITSDPYGHTKAHALAGEGGGYHSEVIQVQTGTNSYTVHHDEVGHTEKVLVKDGYWK